MGIILTSDKRKCPEIANLEVVNVKTIRQYEGNTNVKALICSRDVARVCQHMNIPNLKVIQLFSAGFDNIDPELLQSKGIHLCNAANVYNVGMAEFVVYAMLMHAKRYNHSIKNRRLRPFRNYHYLTELSDKTVGILGAGNIGGQIAKRLEAFDMHVLGYDLHTDDRPHFEKIYNETHLQEFLGRCDYLVNCMPLFKSTEGMLCKKWFDLMKSTVTIVNVGRKKIINDKDFIAFLKSHKDATAVLDMFEKVPNPLTNPYRRLSNVLVLPGVTAISREIDKKLSVLIGGEYETAPIRRTSSQPNSIKHAGQKNVSFVGYREVYHGIAHSDAAYRQRMGAFYGSGARLFRFGQLCGAILFRMQRISLLFEVQYTR